MHAIMKQITCQSYYYPMHHLNHSKKCGVLENMPMQIQEKAKVIHAKCSERFDRKM